MLCPSFCPKPGSLWQVKNFLKISVKSQKKFEISIFQLESKCGSTEYLSINNNFYEETLFSQTLKRNPTYLRPINILLQNITSSKKYTTVVGLLNYEKVEMMYFLSNNPLSS